MNFRLGKQEHQYDERTLMVARYFLPDIRVPAVFDFDRHRHKFPLSMLGNDAWGNCVVVGEANHLMRLERVETRRTIPLSEQDVVDRYKALTGSQSPGDGNDTGLVVLKAMQNWKNFGFALSETNHTHTIAAYGELAPNDAVQLRMACFLLHGIHFGFWLPTAAQKMTDEGVWDYQGQAGPEWKPGSWGGHLVFAKAFTPETFEILTWGQKVQVTNSFIEHFCDEAWAVVDNLDTWRTKQTLDVETLTRHLQEISGKVNE